MLRALPVVVAVVLAVYCLVQVAQSDRAQVRLLPRWLWALLVLVPFAGAAAWLWLGRGRVGGDEPPRPGPRAAPLPPDDDPDFLRQLRNRPAGPDQFRSWEQELREDEDEGHRPE